MRHPIGFETESLILREFTHEDHRNLYTLTRQKEITDGSAGLGHVRGRTDRLS
ncbi:hypothetical protein D3C73_404290 [compost metagenome]